MILKAAAIIALLTLLLGTLMRELNMVNLLLIALTVLCLGVILE